MNSRPPPLQMAHKLCEANYILMFPLPFQRTQSQTYSPWIKAMVTYNVWTRTRAIFTLLRPTVTS